VNVVLTVEKKVIFNMSYAVTEHVYVLVKRRSAGRLDQYVMKQLNNAQVANNSSLSE